MKNTLKFMFVAMAMTAFLAACGGKTEKSGDAQDSVKTETAAPVDTAAQTAPADSVAK